MFLLCCYFNLCYYSLPMAIPYLLFLTRGCSPLLVPNLQLFLTCCSPPIAPPCLLLFVYHNSLFVVPCLSFLPTSCSPHVVFPCFLLHANSSSLLVAPHLSLLLACYSPTIAPPHLLLLACVSLDGIPFPLFAFASTFWSYKQVKTSKQSEFFFLF